MVIGKVQYGTVRERSPTKCVVCVRQTGGIQHRASGSTTALGAYGLRSFHATLLCRYPTKKLARMESKLSNLVVMRIIGDGCHFQEIRF
jgi:hypothetical protein